MKKGGKGPKVKVKDLKPRKNAKGGAMGSKVIRPN